MFEPTTSPRVFGLPPGADFPAELVQGLLNRIGDAPPEALARVTILVNTRRMQRRLKSLLSSGPPRLLPKIALVTELDTLLPAQELPRPVSPLRRRLELTGMIERLIQQDETIAPLSAAVDLADSLASLMGEMQGEGVPLEALTSLEIGDQSGHWDRSLKFLEIVGHYLTATADDQLDPDARQRLAAERLLAAWSLAPPENPVIVAGSTGSRATTSLVMEAVASLPQGAVVLPGFDFHLPDEVWESLSSSTQDHPQYRFSSFIGKLGIGPQQVTNWAEREAQISRNQLISLSLRPAPVTDQWLTDGPKLGDLRPRTAGLTLIEAPQPKDEAAAIAVAIREAVDAGKSVALIATDRTLGRRVSASLARWNIVADDSAGRPLSLTAPGRFIRQVAGLVGKDVDPVRLLAVLKHPLTQSGTSERGPHLFLTREFELFLRKNMIAKVTGTVITAFCNERPETDEPWCTWLADWLGSIATAPAPTLSAALDLHIRAAEALAGGLSGGSGALWERTAGRDTRNVVDRFLGEASFQGTLSFFQYCQLFERALASESTRNYDDARPDVMIWGTLEARVQGADIVILGGLNEGVWPEQPAADPWLNRRLRSEAGLLLPERQIGLSAHDFQQAVAAETVILSRARRDAESETVASRWLSRLTNLLSGLPKQNGETALEQMLESGQVYLDLAARIDRPTATVDPAPRPAPAPLREVRPNRLSITDIEKLIRDPYAIYAKHILHLRPLSPLLLAPDPRIRGTVFHRIVEDAFAIGLDCTDPDATARRLRDFAAKHLSDLPWPAITAEWAGHIDMIAENLAEEEARRREIGSPVALECNGSMTVPGTRILVHGKADRIDRLQDGQLAIYDYKSGQPIAPKQLRFFDRQLPIEAVIAEHGGFNNLAAAPVAFVAHIGLGRKPETRSHNMEESKDVDLRTVTVQGELARLLNSYDVDSRGYPSRRAMEKVRFEGDYDHLARVGEWDETQPAATERLP